MKVGKNKATVEYHAAQQAVTDAMRRVRQANDELADANSELKDASKRLRQATQFAPINLIDALARRYAPS